MGLDNEPAALTHYCVIHAELNTANWIPYLFRLQSSSLRGITGSQFDDPFSVANSTARLAFVGREFFTSSSLSLRQSSFCFRLLSCRVWISEASGGWCSCSTIRLTSGLVTLIEASYSEDEVTTGSVNPRPLMCTGIPRSSRSTLVTVWSVTAGMRISLIARLSGSGNSAICY